MTIWGQKKLVEGELWAEVTGVTIWGQIKILPGMCLMKCGARCH